MRAGAPKPLEVLEGTVERILFHNEENSYTVAGIKPADAAPHSKVEHTIVGSLAGLQPQEVVRLEGEWINDKRYGRQFKVHSYTSVLPSTAAAMEKSVRIWTVGSLLPLFVSFTTNPKSQSALPGSASVPLAGDMPRINLSHQRSART